MLLKSLELKQDAIRLCPHPPIGFEIQVRTPARNGPDIGGRSAITDK